MKTELVEGFAELWRGLGVDGVSRDTLLDTMTMLAYESEVVVLDGVSDWILVRARIAGSATFADLVMDWVHFKGGDDTLASGRIKTGIKRLVEHGWLYKDEEMNRYRPTRRELPSQMTELEP